MGVETERMGVEQIGQTKQLRAPEANVACVAEELDDADSAVGLVYTAWYDEKQSEAKENERATSNTTVHSKSAHIRAHGYLLPQQFFLYLLSTHQASPRKRYHHLARAHPEDAEAMEGQEEHAHPLMHKFQR